MFHEINDQWRESQTANNDRKGLVGSVTLKTDKPTGNENSKQKLE